MTSAHLHLPDAVVQNITSRLMEQGDSQVALVSIMAMCGVSQHWRAIARHLEGGTLHFDSLVSCGRNVLGRPLNAAETAFRKASPAAKGHFFQAAAKLVSGYDQAEFAGEGITDLALVEAARRVGNKLTAITVKDARSVTDAGLASLVLSTRKLTSLRLSNLPRVGGNFLNKLLEHCPVLGSLHLENLPCCWEARGFDAPLSRKATQLHTLNVTGCKVDVGTAALLIRCHNLRSLTFDGQPSVLRVAAAYCPKLEEVRYTASCQEAISEALACLLAAPKLAVLGLTPRNVTLLPGQLHTLGMLPLTELRLNSYVYTQQPAINRASQSHLDNEGVRALVDGVCHRVSANPGEGQKPFKLSLCGATALTHDAVSALLRLPLLSELRIDGCFRINSMDKMRLVAKVKAGASFGAGSSSSNGAASSSSPGSAGCASSSIGRGGRDAGAGGRRFALHGPHEMPALPAQASRLLRGQA